MNHHKSISVAMATYNGELYIEKQLRSIVSQTYQPTEIVICDDHSTDNTVKILNTFASQFKHIQWRIIQNEIRLGVIENFKKAILLTTGDYIALSDQDDIWADNKLAILFSYLEKGCALVHSNAELIDKDDKVIHPSFSELKPKECSLTSYINGKNNVTGCACMFSSKLKSLFGSFPEVFFYHDGWIAVLAYNNGGIVYCDRVLVKYRQHDKNVVGVSFNDDKKDINSKSFIFSKKKAKVYMLMLKERNRIKLNQYQTMICIRYWFTCITGLAAIKFRVLDYIQK